MSEGYPPGVADGFLLLSETLETKVDLGDRVHIPAAGSHT